MFRLKRFFGLGSVLFSVAAVMLPTLMPSPLAAIESAGIGALPAHPRPDNPRTSSIFVLEAKPGSTLQDGVKIINNSDQQKNIRVYAVDSQHSSDGAFACAQEADKKVQVGNWVKLTKQEVTLAAGESEVIPFKVSLPANVAPGEHNGCIAIQESASPKPGSTNGIVLSFRSALRVAITVPGNVKANVSFLDILYLFKKEKVQLSPVLKNEGNVSVDAKINVGLKNIFGGTSASSGGQFALLSSEESRFNFETERPFWGGVYQKTASAEYMPLRESPQKDETRKVATAQLGWVFITPHPVALLVEVAVPLLVASGVFYWLWRRKQHQFFAMRSIVHTVKPGEDIQSLAERSGMKWKKLAKLNKLKPPYTLAAGQKIKLPYAHHAPSRQSHKK